MARTVQQLFDLSGKTALVTGASRGLGLQLAQALGEAGARLFITSRKAADLEQAAALLRAKGITVDAMAADCADPSHIEKLAQQALATLGHVDVLVNNAGAAWGAAAEDHPLEAWDKLIALNLVGGFVMAQQAAKKCMIPARWGRIVNVASVAGLFASDPAVAKTVSYNATKHAMVGMTKQLAAEWGEHGITVNAICPGFFPSKMTRATLDTTGEIMRRTTPTRRLGNDEDLKGVAVLLASEAGRHITGHAIAVDGGAMII